MLYIRRSELFVSGTPLPLLHKRLVDLLRRLASSNCDVAGHRLADGAFAALPLLLVPPAPRDRRELHSHCFSLVVCRRPAFLLAAAIRNNNYHIRPTAPPAHRAYPTRHTTSSKPLHDSS